MALTWGKGREAEQEQEPGAIGEWLKEVASFAADAAEAAANLPAELRTLRDDPQQVSRYTLAHRGRIRIRD